EVVSWLASWTFTRRKSQYQNTPVLRTDCPGDPSAPPRPAKQLPERLRWRLCACLTCLDMGWVGRVTMARRARRPLLKFAVLEKLRPGTPSAAAEAIQQLRTSLSGLGSPRRLRSLPLSPETRLVLGAGSGQG